MGYIQFRPANCKNCYKCIRHCAVKAIAFENEQAKVLENECILCGQCTLVCPQNAKQIKSDLPRVQKEIGHGIFVASVAPSYAAAWPGVSFAVLSRALKQLGFAYVEETAIGASEVTAAYQTLLETGEMDNVLSTCCPTAVALVEKHYPELTKYLAPVASPASVHARMAHALYGAQAKVVFIGPCFSKKLEAGPGKELFAVLTLSELKHWLADAGVGLDEPDDQAAEMQQTQSRLYPMPGGVVATLPSGARGPYRCLSVDGLDRCMQTLEALRTHALKGYFIELSACAGSCLGGPGLAEDRLPLVLAREEIVQSARQTPTAAHAPLTEHAKVDVTAAYRPQPLCLAQPTEQQVWDILAQLGKFTVQDCLNCGACGYPTCWDKAVAVFQGKADLHMCLPYMREKAESMSNEILAHTPNAILLVGTDGQILQANPAAERLFAAPAQRLKGMAVDALLDGAPYHAAKAQGAPVLDVAARTTDGAHEVEQSVVPLPNGDAIVLVKDVTEEQQKRRELERLQKETVDTAQRVIDKQMRVAQEIASLLGETTGETKVALTKLKRSIVREPKA